MNYSAMIAELEEGIANQQKVIDILRMLDDKMCNEVMLDRQQTADFLGVSLRQVDRRCELFGIKKHQTIKGVRICKRDLLVHMKLVPQDKMSTLDCIVKKAISQ